MSASDPGLNRRTAVTMEFHVSREARDRYGLDTQWFSLTGNVVFADLASTRRLALAINRGRDTAHHPERALSAGALHAMGLIDEILHFVTALYRREVRPGAMAVALAAVERRLGRERLDSLLRRFADRFPPLAVY